LSDEKNSVLDVINLSTEFRIHGNRKKLLAVNNVSFSVKSGEILGIVGESGSGKSVTSRSIMRLVKPPGFITNGKILFGGRDLLSINENEMQKIRGKDISIIFQNPTTSLNPLFKIETQMINSLRAHFKISIKEARKEAIDTLTKVGIADASLILSKYPCEFSDGFIQRIVLAMTMLCKPRIIIADEPTTNLGVTVQQIILESLKVIKENTGVSVIFITHDFGVIAQLADRVQVMYAGRIVESGNKVDLLRKPMNPYTKGLLTTVPSFRRMIRGEGKKLNVIPGFPPDMLDSPRGCAFAPRCSRKINKCKYKKPSLEYYPKEKRFCACFNPEFE